MGGFTTVTEPAQRPFVGYLACPLGSRNLGEPCRSNRDELHVISFPLKGGSTERGRRFGGMAWFLTAAVVVVVVAIAIASTAWALAVREGIRLVDRLTRRPPD